MPRIRKQTSNRVKSNDRAKLKKKVRDGKKKKAKLAKKNVQWKSKKSKDPGIPNEFPYKDQILAEVAAQRRLAEEEKEKKKEEKQKALARVRAIARGEIVEDEEGSLLEEGDNGEGEDGGPDDDQGDDSGKPRKKDLNVGAESIASLSAKIVQASLKPRPKPTVEQVDESDEEEELPVLVNRDLPNLKAVLEKADVVLEVLDARDPLPYRSKHVEELAQEKGKQILFVVNKIDLCPREALAAWTGHLRAHQPTLPFRSASLFIPEPQTQSQHAPKKGKGKAKVPVDDAVGADSILSCLGRWAKEKGDGPLSVAVVGVANVGKSSLINSLLKRAALPVYTPSSLSRGPTTTGLPQEVSLDIEDQKLTLIDTPGLSFISEADGDASLLEQCRARDILLRSKGRIDRLKDPSLPIEHIVSTANAEDLMLLYSLPAFAKGDATAFLSGVARANQLVKKRGALDLAGAARIVLRDWSLGKLSRFSTPPTPTGPVTAPENDSAGSSSKSQAQFHSASTTPGTHNAQLYAKDDAILATLPTRKELRKKGGLVRFSPGAVDQRRAAVEEDWAGLEDSEDEQSDDNEDAADDVEGMDVDEEEDSEEEGHEEEGHEEEDEEEDDSEPLIQAPLSNKQKRKRGLDKSAPERPVKKVTFEPPKKPNKPAHNRPLEPTQASMPREVGALAPTSSEKAVLRAKPALKASSSAAAAKKPPSGNNAKVANVKPKTKASAAAAAVSRTTTDADEPEDYDFGKFF